MIDFDGQAVIVTGAGRGLGRQYALELARRGAQVVVNDIGGSVSGDGADTSVAAEVVTEIEKAGGVAVASGDSVATPEGGQAIVAAALDAFGRVDAVVSNAGIHELVRFEDLTKDQWHRMLEVHLDGAFHVAQPAYRAMLTQGYGRFVLIGSSVGAFGMEDYTHYGAAKGGVIGLNRSLALEGAPHGIHSNVVLPTGHTRMTEHSITADERSSALEALLAQTRPERVAPAVVYLASRRCQLNQCVISAGGGAFARVFTGLAKGWSATPGTEPTAEDLADHIEQVVSTEEFSVPANSAEEMAALFAELDIF